MDNDVDNKTRNLQVLRNDSAEPPNEDPTRSAHAVPLAADSVELHPQQLPLYSVFTRKQKWAIVVLAACAGLFSPLGANIYFPAIPSLSKAFDKSVQDINLTVTIYMIFQGVAPSLWGSIADSYGRRPIYICCLALFAITQIALAVIPTSAYAALLVLRCFSAAGSAPVIALGAGTVGDISVPAERGKYMGTATMGAMLGPCIGPVFGGLLNQHWGWRAIFWFLAILSMAILILFVLFFPETLRAVVGNGSIPARGLNRTAWSVISRQNRARQGLAPGNTEIKTERALRKEINPFNALHFIIEKDVAIILFYNAFNYTAFYSVTTTLATVLESTYGLSTSKTGLCYLPIGLGMLSSTVTSGHMTDYQFRRTRRRIEQRRMKDVERGAETKLQEEHAKKSLDPNDLLDFPLEHARLCLQPIYSFIFWSSVVAYGWTVHSRAPLEVALIIQFIIGWTIVSVMQINQVMLVDLYPGKGASVTANNNLFRCVIGAIGTAVVDPIMREVGTCWTMMIFVSVPILFSPFMVLEWRIGMHWRQERENRLRKAEVGQKTAGNGNTPPQARAETETAEGDEKKLREVEPPTKILDGRQERNS